MHGLINRALQCFLRDTYGAEFWAEIARDADLGISNFEAMLFYEDNLTDRMLTTAATALNKAREDLLEDLGTYLVSHENLQSLRRLLRFGGGTYLEFLHSLDDLPDRVRMAVPDLALPVIEVYDHAGGVFSLRCGREHAGYAHVVMGVVRALADDYGALVFLEHLGRTGDRDIIEVTLLEAAFSEGRSFELAPKAQTEELVSDKVRAEAS